MNQFLEDVLQGLGSNPKYLDSKYFYDKKGDELFQSIMNCEEYYLTKCEMEIFSAQTQQLAALLVQQHSIFNIAELGPGDAVKSLHLLKNLAAQNAIDTYFPVDISNNIIDLLNKKIPEYLPELCIHGLCGEYLHMLTEARKISDKKMLVLFLGSNIGNFSKDKVNEFCKELRNRLSKGDMVLIGIDLKKNPRQIRNAYDDKEGYTRAFNLNLLSRINHELNGNFIIKQFEHYASYDPVSGACRSFIVSLADQKAEIADHAFTFAKNECVYMEISQKYSIQETDEIACSCGFEPVAHFYDSQKWFTDVLWKCV